MSAAPRNPETRHWSRCFRDYWPLIAATISVCAITTKCTADRVVAHEALPWHAQGGEKVEEFTQGIAELDRDISRILEAQAWIKKSLESLHGKVDAIRP